MNGIMVHMADTKWTTGAIRAACAFAQGHAELGKWVALVRMLPSDMLHWTGDEAKDYHFTESEQEDIAHYRAIAEEHGLRMTVHAFEYNEHRFDEGVVNIADALDIQDVLVEIEPSILPFLHSRHIRHLGHLLETHHHHLLTMDHQPAVDADWKPEVEEYEE
ncbi:MAG: hypothetical protein JNL42_12675 [Anaerolineae bacterium]|nr:hypothetical protein [Anaerolineae bacterium]